MAKTKTKTKSDAVADGCLPPSPLRYFLNGSTTEAKNKLKVHLTGGKNTIKIEGDDFDPAAVGFVAFAPGVSLYEFEIVGTPTANVIKGKFEASGFILPGLKVTLTLIVFNRAGSPRPVEVGTGL